MGGARLEVFKFSLYLSIPVVATVIYASPSNMEVRRGTGAKDRLEGGCR